jgi:uncharacterized protein with PhoU and TrkA domain
LILLQIDQLRQACATGIIDILNATKGTDAATKVDHVVRRISQPPFVFVKNLADSKEQLPFHESIAGGSKLQAYSLARHRPSQ